MSRLKLLADADAPHLPDAPQALRPWYAQWLRRVLLLAFSQSGITMMIGACLALALTCIISFNQWDISREVDKNGFSKRDFYADFRMEIVDREATQRKIERARQALTPIYQDTTLHNQDILRHLNRLIAEFRLLNTDAAIPVSDKHSRFEQWANGASQSEEIFRRYMLRSIPAEEWENIAKTTRAALENILQQGFTEADEQLKRQSTIEAAIPRNIAYRPLIRFLVDASLEPNLILDENAMRRRQDQVEAQLAQKPEVRTYMPGQKIVSRREKVSPVAMAALEKMGKASGGSAWIAFIGELMLSALFVLTLWSYLYRFRDRQFFRPSYASLLSALIASTVIFYQLQDADGVSQAAFPLGALALTIAIFTHQNVSILITTLLVFLMALTLNVGFQNLTVLLFGCYVGVYVLGRRINYSDRGQLLYAGIYIGLTNALIMMAITLAQSSTVTGMAFITEGGRGGEAILFKLGWSFFSGVFSAVLTIGMLPLLETVFRLVTPYTLMELGNHDQPLLKRMQFEAPGTFHHSLMVATLAEAAAEAIGANALLTRVGCLYHDIGKMKRPLFFIENQAYFGVENPHDKLTPRLSKMVITAHPRDSIEMAKQHKLPEVLMKFMTEHHGTLTAGYFYNKACIEEGVENVNKSQFRYPGPKPGSKETAIVMLADACESSVRALKTPTVAQVEERIDLIIRQRVEDGQFDNCPITFQDIHRIKQTFVRVLRGIQHNRIEYQQNIMRELGRKPQEPAGLQSALIRAQEQKPGGKDKDGKNKGQNQQQQAQDL